MKTTPFHTGRHLPAESLTDATDRCRGCGNSLPRKSVHRIQRSPRVDLLACSRCGIASASMMPTDAALEAYYGAYYEHGRPRHTFDNVERFGRHVGAFVRGRFECVRILDFGGGDGALAVEVARHLVGNGQAQTAEIVVVDPCPVGACEDADIALRGAVSLDDVDGRFDVLLASAVLEHIPEVGETFVRLVALGAPGAVLYARTPWWAPLMRAIPNVDMTFPAHVHDMGPAFWNRVNETFGVDLIPVASRPSLVETTLTESPLRTVMAYALKAPSLVEVAVRPTGWKRAWWKFVGGWEAVFTFPDFHEEP